MRFVLPLYCRPAISAMPVVIAEGVRQRRHVRAVMVGNAVGDACGITSLMVKAYRPPRSPADLAPPLDAAGHVLGRGSRLQPRLSAQVKQEYRPGRVPIFSAVKAVITLPPIEEGARRPPVVVYAARAMGVSPLASMTLHIVSVAR